MTTAIEGGFFFEGITPDEDLREEARRVFDEIAGLAPYGANFDARIALREQSYVIELMITSSEGRFKAVAQADSWNEALLQIEHTMQGKFECWRRNRFLHPPGGWDARQLAA